MATRGRAIVEASSLDEIASIAPERFGIVDALAQLLLEAAFRPAPLVESGVSTTTKKRGMLRASRRRGVSRRAAGGSKPGVTLRQDLGAEPA